MKLHYCLALLFILFITTGSFAQKKDKLEINYDKKTEIATVDGKQVFKVINAGSASSGYKFEVASLEGKKLITFVYVYYNDLREADKYNSSGRVSYYDIIFEDAPDIKVDCKWYGMKWGIKFIYENNLIVDGKLDLEAAKAFARRQGTVNYEKRMTAR